MKFYRLYKRLQKESGTLQSLQEDKVLLERAIGGLKNKLKTVHCNSAGNELYRRHQRLLRRELTRALSILALNSKLIRGTLLKKGVNNLWVETYLDNEKAEIATSRSATSPRQHAIYISPLYINTDSVKNH